MSCLVPVDYSPLLISYIPSPIITFRPLTINEANLFVLATSKAAGKRKGGKGESEREKAKGKRWDGQYIGTCALTNSSCRNQMGLVERKRNTDLFTVGPTWP